MRTASIGLPLNEAKKTATLTLQAGVQILGAHVQDAYTLVVDYAYEFAEPEFDAAGMYVEPKRQYVHFKLAKTGDYLSRHLTWCVPVKVDTSLYLFYAFQ